MSAPLRNLNFSFRNSHCSSFVSHRIMNDLSKYQLWSRGHSPRGPLNVLSVGLQLKNTYCTCTSFGYEVMSFGKFDCSCVSKIYGTPSPKYHTLKSTPYLQVLQCFIGPKTWPIDIPGNWQKNKLILDLDDDATVTKALIQLFTQHRPFIYARSSQSVILIIPTSKILDASFFKLMLAVKCQRPTEILNVVIETISNNHDDIMVCKHFYTHNFKNIYIGSSISVIEFTYWTITHTYFCS